MADSSYGGAFGKVALLAALVGIAVFAVGFSTKYWRKNAFVNEGLWGYCIGDLCSDGHVSDVIDRLSDGDWSWLEATQAFETLGFIAGLAALVLIILYIFVPATAGKRVVFLLSMVMCFAAAGCIILGIIIYGANASNLSWSFALCTIAGIIFGVAGILLLVDFCKR